MKFCIVVFYDLTNDISYNAKLNRSKVCYFGDEIVKIMLKIARNRKIYVVSIFLNIFVLNFAQW